jgi:hypothetical protein
MTMAKPRPRLSPRTNITPITDPSWQNAPPLVRIAASQQGGTRGAQIWGITEKYTLITNFQETPGGIWAGWSPMGSGPVQAGVSEVTAAQQNDGRVELWVTDPEEQLWTMWQTSPGGNWSGWAGPNWNSAPLLSTIAACQQGGARGAQLWGITNENVLITCFQVSPGGGWSAWDTSSFLDAPPAFAVTAAQQNNGCVQIWMLDEDQQLMSASQTSPGGDWTGWSAPKWNGAPQLMEIVACQQGGARGAQLWGIDPGYALWSTYQETPGGTWSSWIGPNWEGATKLAQLAAAQQNNGCVELWGIDTNLAVKTISQTSPGGDWTVWSP